MSLWFLALKAREAGNRPRTFYTGLTVVVVVHALQGWTAERIPTMRF